MNFQNFKIDHKTHNDLKKKLNKSKHNTIEQYKSMICPQCVHYKNIDYQDCKITIRINNEAGCVNYKCKDYYRNKEK